MRTALTLVAVLVLLVSAVPAAAPVNLDEPVVVTKAMLLDLALMNMQTRAIIYRYDPGSDTAYATLQLDMLSTFSSKQAPQWKASMKNRADLDLSKLLTFLRRYISPTAKAACEGW